MAAESNRGFARGLMPSASRALQMVSFGNSGSLASPSQIQINGNGGAGIFGYGSGISGGSVGGLTQAGPSSSNVVAVTGARQEEQGLTSEWTLEEQAILNRELVKYAAEHTMMKYIKVAAMLPRKTVRDVAVRCRWLANHNNTKRQRFEEMSTGNRMKDKKEIVVESCSNANIPMVSPGNMSSYTSTFHPVNQNDQFSCEAPVLDGATLQLMNTNAQILNQISSNLAASKTQENIELFYFAKTNIATILRNMSNMPGKMGMMPSLPVSINESFLNDIILYQREKLMSGLPGIYLEEKQQQQPPNQPRHGNL